MDARPQRPVRAIFAQGDENIVPAASTKQSVHQRHKSTGTLSSMLTVGGLKAAAKRTAFGDVSNTARTLVTVNDGSVTVSKSSQLDLVKPIAVQDKSTSLLRPAQRPLNAAPSKAILSNTTNPAEPVALVNAAKAPLAEVRQQQPVGPASKRTLSRRGTTIYKDTKAEDNIEQVASVAKAESAPIAPVHQILEPRPYSSQAQLEQTDPVLRRTQSRYIGSQDMNSDATIPSDTVYVDALEPAISSTNAYESHMRFTEEKREEEIRADDVRPFQEPIVQTRRSLPTAAAGSEPEEYWEDEEEEIYDEHGYTTAHSYRSRGDNTTGAATTVLFPKTTNRTKREIADAKDAVESSRTQEDIEDEAWDTTMVAEYGDEIFAYMRDLEMKMLPNAHYMDNQAEIQWSMRSVLMDWLIQVHHRFSLFPETLFLCVNYVDRFLSCKIVSLGKLQLVGATAIFVAAKYEEINCPSVSEIVYMVDGGYTVDEILKAERFMLSMLQFELGWPGPMSFLRRISKADDYDLETRTLAKYFLEVTIMDERFVGSPPSYIAAGAHCLARLMLKKGDWSQAHVYYSGYTWTQLRPLVSMMVECCENPQKHHSAVFDKYSDRRYKRASLFVQNEMDRGFTLPALHNFRPSLPSFDDVASHMPFETRESFKRMVQVKG